MALERAQPDDNGRYMRPKYGQLSKFDYGRPMNGCELVFSSVTEWPLAMVGPEQFGRWIWAWMPFLLDLGLSGRGDLREGESRLEFV